MTIKTRQLIIFIGGFFLFCLDQYIKYLSRVIFTSNLLIGKMIGWQPFINHGVAFGLPLPNIITIIFTAPVLIIIGLVLNHYFQHPDKIFFFVGLTFIFWGAFSNLIDRSIFQSTIDYFLIGTSVINLADIMIVCGFIFYLLPNKFFKT